MVLVCERHEEIMDRLDSYGKRIGLLEVSYAEMKVDLKNLIKQVERLVSTINKLTFALLGTGIGFIIWFIQNH